MTLLVLAKRMGLALSEMASVDIETLIMASDAWAGREVDYVRDATQSDIDKLMS